MKQTRKKSSLFGRKRTATKAEREKLAVAEAVAKEKEAAKKDKAATLLNQLKQDAVRIVARVRTAADLAEGNDVFVGYRQATDTDLTETLQKNVLLQFHSSLKHDPEVFMDKQGGLEYGEEWEEGFVNGLFNSRLAVPVMTWHEDSAGSVGQLMMLTEDSDCDNVLLEYEMALAILDHQKDLLSILPVVAGPEYVVMNNKQYANFPFEKVEELPDIIAVQTKVKLVQHCKRLQISLRDDALTRTVKQTVQRLLKNHAIALSLHGVTSRALEYAAKEIVHKALSQEKSTKSPQSRETRSRSTFQRHIRRALAENSLGTPPTPHTASHEEEKEEGIVRSLKAGKGNGLVEDVKSVQSKQEQLGHVGEWPVSHGRKTSNANAKPVPAIIRGALAAKALCVIPLTKERNPFSFTSRRTLSIDKSSVINMLRTETHMGKFLRNPDFSRISKQRILEHVESLNLELVLSPEHAVTLKGIARRRANIPDSATAYCYCYPLAASKDLPKDVNDRASPLLSLLHNGGFVYTGKNSSNPILAVNAITHASSANDHIILLERGTPIKNRDVGDQLDRLRRLGPTSDPSVTHGWIIPNEEIVGESFEPSGGFLYRYDHGTTVTDWYIAVVPSGVTAHDDDDNVAWTRHYSAFESSYVKHLSLTIRDSTSKTYDVHLTTQRGNTMTITTNEKKRNLLVAGLEEAERSGLDIVSVWNKWITGETGGEYASTPRESKKMSDQKYDTFDRTFSTDESSWISRIQISLSRREICITDTQNCSALYVVKSTEASTFKDQLASMDFKQDSVGAFVNNWKARRFPRSRSGTYRELERKLEKVEQEKQEAEQELEERKSQLEKLHNNGSFNLNPSEMKVEDSAHILITSCPEVGFDQFPVRKEVEKLCSTLDCVQVVNMWSTGKVGSNLYETENEQWKILQQKGGLFDRYKKSSNMEERMQAFTEMRTRVQAMRRFQDYRNAVKIEIMKHCTMLVGDKCKEVMLVGIEGGPLARVEAMEVPMMKEEVEAELKGRGRKLSEIRISIHKFKTFEDFVRSGLFQSRSKLDSDLSKSGSKLDSGLFDTSPPVSPPPNLRAHKGRLKKKGSFRWEGFTTIFDGATGELKFLSTTTDGEKEELSLILENYQERSIKTAPVFGRTKEHGFLLQPASNAPPFEVYINTGREYEEWKTVFDASVAYRMSTTFKTEMEAANVNMARLKQNLDDIQAQQSPSAHRGILLTIKEQMSAECDILRRKQALFGKLLENMKQKNVDSQLYQQLEAQKNDFASRSTPLLQAAETATQNPNQQTGDPANRD